MGLRTLWVVLLTAGIGACASTPPTTIVLPANQVPLSAEQRASAMKLFESHGIRYEIAYDDDGMVVFHYGGRQHRLSEDAFLEFARSRIIGQSIVGVRRPSLTAASGEVLAQVTYFSPSSTAYSWTPGQFGVVPAEVTFLPPTRDQKARGFVGGLMCYSAITNQSRYCTSVYDQLIGAAGRHEGDPFHLGGLQAPDGLTASSAWPDGQPLVPARAPHD